MAVCEGKRETARESGISLPGIQSRAQRWSLRRVDSKMAAKQKTNLQDIFGAASSGQI